MLVSEAFSMILKRLPALLLVGLFIGFALGFKAGDVFRSLTVTRAQDACHRLSKSLLDLEGEVDQEHPGNHRAPEFHE